MPQWLICVRTVCVTARGLYERGLCKSGLVQKQTVSARAVHARAVCARVVQFVRERPGLCKSGPCDSSFYGSGPCKSCLCESGLCERSMWVSVRAVNLCESSPDRPSFLDLLLAIVASQDWSYTTH